MTETATRYWKPVTFKVGDRVRYRANAECQYAAVDLDGSEGVLLHVDPNEEHGHGYLVILDSGLPGSFAATELELLDSAS